LNSAFFYYIYSEYTDNPVQLYLVTVMSTIVFSVFGDILDIGSRKRKAVISVSLYALAMCTVLAGEHRDLLFVGRVLYGAGAALHHSSFEAYVVHEHGSLGFPDEWLSQTFTLLTHFMALLACAVGVVGQTTASFGGVHAALFLCIALFTAAAVHVSLSWTKDISSPKFMFTTFVGNLAQTLGAARRSTALGHFILISGFAETAFTIFAYHWAQLVASLIREEGLGVPYALVFSAYVCTSMVGAYLHSLFAVKLGTEIFFQGVLSGLVASFSLASMVQTPMVVFLASLLVYGFVGAYWPCIGTLRARAVGAEQRAAAQTLSRSLGAILATAVLYHFHRSNTIVLGSCAVCVAVAAFLQNQSMQQVNQ
jgi:hypothetical protein